MVIAVQTPNAFWSPAATNVHTSLQRKAWQF